MKTQLSKEPVPEILKSRIKRNTGTGSTGGTQGRMKKEKSSLVWIGCNPSSTKKSKTTGVGWKIKKKIEGENVTEL